MNHERNMYWTSGIWYELVKPSAKDGYNLLIDARFEDELSEVPLDGLMKGEDMVVPGFRNKLQIVMSGVMADAKLADKMNKNQEPVSSK